MNRLMIGIAGAALTVGVVRGQETKIATAFVRTPLESKTIKGAPYSAEFVNDFVQTLPDGNRIVRHSTGRVYRDSEGRVRREEDRPSGQPGISITDPIAGASYSLNPETHVAMKTPAFAGVILTSKLEELKTSIEGRTDLGYVETRALEPGTVVVPDGSGVVEFNGGRFTVRRPGEAEKRNAETLASKVIEGVLADGRRTTTTIAAGAIGKQRET